MDLLDLERLKSYQTSKDGLTNMSRRIRVNPLIAEYYERLGEENYDLVKRRFHTVKRKPSYELENFASYGIDVSDPEEFQLLKRYTREDEATEKDEDLIDYKVAEWQDFKDLMFRRSQRILSCGRTIETKVFDGFNTHYIKRVKLCCDKFCGNCQKQLSNARERKYKPLLNELAKYYDLYHITFTVPNPSGLFLRQTVSDIFKAYSKFTKIISGKKKIRGMNFENLGYEGSLRSLEITTNDGGKTYHPHLHCIFVFKKGLGLDQPKVFTNPFSYNHGRKKQQFSAFEVLVQKLWYLCYEGKTVTKKALDALENGYSCIVNNADGKYHQIFKYAIKGLLDERKAEMKKNKNRNRDEPLEQGITFEIFQDLFFALEHRRAVQGYGCFYGLKFDETVLTDPDVLDKEVDEMVKALSKANGGGYNQNERLADVLRNIMEKHTIYFSKRSIQQNLESLKDDD